MDTRDLTDDDEEVAPKEVIGTTETVTIIELAEDES